MAGRRRVSFHEPPEEQTVEDARDLRKRHDFMPGDRPASIFDESSVIGVGPVPAQDAYGSLEGIDRYMPSGVFAGGICAALILVGIILVLILLAKEGGKKAAEFVQDDGEEPGGPSAVASGVPNDTSATTASSSMESDGSLETTGSEGRGRRVTQEVAELTVDSDAI